MGSLKEELGDALRESLTSMGISLKRVSFAWGRSSLMMAVDGPTEAEMKKLNAVVKGLPRELRVHVVGVFPGRAVGADG